MSHREPPMSKYVPAEWNSQPSSTSDIWCIRIPGDPHQFSKLVDGVGQAPGGTTDRWSERISLAPTCTHAAHMQREDARTITGRRILKHTVFGASVMPNEALQLPSPSNAAADAFSSCHSGADGALLSTILYVGLSIARSEEPVALPAAARAAS